MFKKNALLRGITEIFIIAVPLALRAASGFTDKGGAVIYVFYAVAVLSAIRIAADAFTYKAEKNAFETNSSFGLSIAAYLLSAGMFVDFINCSLSVVTILSNGEYIAGMVVFTKCFTAFCALLSTIYFIAAGLTFGKSRYDFRYLKVLHLVPIGWAAGRMLELLIDAGISSFYDLSSILKCVMLIIAVCFFYSFAREVENNENLKPSTVLLSGELSYFSLLLVYDFAINAVKSRGDSLKYDSLFCITAITVCIFCFLFKKNIISGKTNTEN